jgi:hypothetical protein
MGHRPPHRRLAYTVFRRRFGSLVTFGQKEQGVAEGFQDRPKVGRRMLNLAKTGTLGRTRVSNALFRLFRCFKYHNSAKPFTLSPMAG